MRCAGCASEIALKLIQKLCISAIRLFRTTEYGKVIPLDTLMEVVMAATTVRPVAIKIDDDIKFRVKRLADARHRSAHWLMRQAITEYVDREEKRETFRQDTLKAWEEYRTTGLHVTAAEADTWLDQLEQGNDIEPPACHI